MKSLLMAILLIAQVYGQAQPPDQKFAGTWRRYTNHQLVEVFEMRPDHSWSADLFDTKGHPAGKEKGKWQQKGDHLTFSFILPVQPSVTAAFTFRKDRILVIGKNVYYKD